MNTDSATMLYFSPTGTTKKIVQGIARGAGARNVDLIDLTPTDAATGQPKKPAEGLVIIGSPVYAGRLPNDMVSRLKRIKGNGAPAVIIVVFGNRAYDDALLELRDVALETGFKPIAAGAFIGEHSFSTAATPIAAGRPDGDDVRKAEEFGRMICGKMKTLRSMEGLASFQVPGKFPYKDRSALSNISPVTEEAVCTKCENCASACPVAAITVRDTVMTERSVCTRCCACVKACSNGARIMDDPRLRQIAEQLSTNCRDRKEPELYL